MTQSFVGGRRRIYRKHKRSRGRKGGNVLGAALSRGALPLTLLALNNYLGKKSYRQLIRRHGRRTRS